MRVSFQRALAIIIFSMIESQSFSAAIKSGNSAGASDFFAAGPFSITPWGDLACGSIIEARGLTGVINRVTVTLSNLAHTWPADLDVLLIGPDGTRVVLLSDAGGTNAIQDVTLEVSDDAPVPVGQSALVPGNFRPTDYDLRETYLGLCDNDLAPFSADLAAFNNRAPNGNWRLMILDDYPPADDGSLEGWSLHIETGPHTNAPVFVEEPLSHVGYVGTSNTFFGRLAIPDAFTSLTWFMNGTMLTNSIKISGADSERLVIRDFTPSDSGELFVVATNLYGSVTSRVATLLISITNRAAYVRLQSLDVTVRIHGASACLDNLSIGYGNDSVLFQYSRWGFHFASNIYMHVNSTGYHMVPMALTSLTSNQATFRGFSTTYAGDALVERDFHLVGNPPVLRVDTRVWNTSNTAADVRSFEFFQPAHGDYYGGQYNYSDRDVIRTNSVSIGEARFPWALGTMALGVVGTNGRVSAAHGSGLWGASDVDVHFASEPWDPEGLHTYNYMIAGYDGVIRPGGYRTSSTFYALVMPEGDARRRVELAMTATSNARFRITQALPLLLELETRPGIRWRVESSDNLGEDWQAVFELETADYMTRFPDPRPTASHRFFRAVRVD